MEKILKPFFTTKHLITSTIGLKAMTNFRNDIWSILVYLGAEEPIDEDLAAVGFLVDNAVQFNSLLVFIEVRIQLVHLI